VDIDSDDKRVQEEIKEGDGQKAIDEMYGVSEEEVKERKLKLYETLKEKKIDTIAKVKEILKSIFPDEDWASIKKDVFEKMPGEKIQQVIEYLKQ
jgi:hypothetical protein